MKKIDFFPKIFTTTYPPPPPLEKFLDSCLLSYISCYWREMMFEIPMVKTKRLKLSR